MRSISVEDEDNQLAVAASACSADASEDAADGSLDLGQRRPLSLDLDDVIGAADLKKCADDVIHFKCSNSLR
jgi:hypothetical protein